MTIYKEPYLPDDKLVEAVNLAIALGRPLLLQGEPGCGKTRLAYAVAYALGLPLEVSYIKSTSRAQDLLYTYDAVNRLYDAQLGAEGQRSRDIRNYIQLGPLGRAIARAQYGRRSVVLIDEIDKADLDFPNDLLWELDRLEFRVTEAPEIYYAVGKNPALRPIVFVTHNEEKALPTAFLRRCIFHYVEFPETEEDLQQVLATHEISNPELSKKAIEVLLKLRDINLTKPPGLSELLDWVGYLKAVETPVEELDKLPYLGALLKQEIDRQRAMEAFAKQ
ncbi:AAA family ATPase [Scytonema sp. HK-05]|nr:AAA family ATPase [Scytonema sp. HK-05]